MPKRSEKKGFVSVFGLVKKKGIFGPENEKEIRFRFRAWAATASRGEFSSTPFLVLNFSEIMTKISLGKNGFSPPFHMSFVCERRI